MPNILYNLAFEKLTVDALRTTNKFMNGKLWKCTTIADEPTSLLNNSQASCNLVVIFDLTRKTLNSPHLL